MTRPRITPEHCFDLIGALTVIAIILLIESVVYILVEYPLVLLFIVLTVILYVKFKNNRIY